MQAFTPPELGNQAFGEDAGVTGLVSIVIPCYNGERFLAETLDSAFTQTYPLTEIVIVDDGSLDGSAALIRSYGDRVRAEFGPNRGASAARNRGTALARGEFIQYLDADDLLTENAVARRVSALRTESAEVAYSDWEKLIEDEAGEFHAGDQTARLIEDVNPNVEIALITDFWAPPAALTYRRSIVHKIGGWNEGLPVIQDARFLQDAAHAGARFVHAPGIGARYRVHRGASLSRRSQTAFVADVFRNGCDWHARYKAAGRLGPEECRALAQIYDYTARSQFFADRPVFRECVSCLYEVEPGFRMTWPKVASVASSAMGFPVAGALMRGAESLRRMLRAVS